MAGSYVPMLRYYRQPLWLAPLLPFTASLYLLMTVDSAVRHHRGRGAAWKGGRTRARRRRRSGERAPAPGALSQSACPTPPSGASIRRLRPTPGPASSRKSHFRYG